MNYITELILFVQGALWNGGVFAYKMGYVMDKAHEMMDFTDYQDLFDKYDTMKKISFDYAVAEHDEVSAEGTYSQG